MVGKDILGWKVYTFSIDLRQGVQGLVSLWLKNLDKYLKEKKCQVIFCFKLQMNMKQDYSDFSPWAWAVNIILNIVWT